MVVVVVVVVVVMHASGDCDIGPTGSSPSLTVIGTLFWVDMVRRSLSGGEEKKRREEKEEERKR